VLILSQKKRKNLIVVKFCVGSKQLVTLLQ